MLLEYGVRERDGVVLVKIVAARILTPDVLLIPPCCIKAARDIVADLTSSWVCFWMKPAWPRTTDKTLRVWVSFLIELSDCVV